MLHHHIKFEHVITGHKEYRSYPAIAQWATRKQLAEFLANRDFLLDYIPVKVTTA